MPQEKNPRFMELARDLIAFGSIPFLVLTVIRVSFMNKLYYPFEIIAGSAIFFILRAFSKAEMRAGISLILLVFVSLYYASTLFSVFAALIYFGIVRALFYLGKSRGQIIKGISFGLIGTAIAYRLALFLR